MKYIFVAPIHYMEISTTLKRGIKLKDNIRISNDNDFIENLFSKTDIYEWVGAVGYHELKNSTYAYATGNLKDLIEVNGDTTNYLTYCFYFLREVQIFLNDLWCIKDHSSYVRDGFICVYEGENNDLTQLQKSSLSSVRSNSEGEVQSTNFSKDDIIQANKLYEQKENYDLNSTREGGKYPLLNPFDKSLTRVERANAFIYMACGESTLPLKLINYCTALECLFTSDNTEVAHKIAERTAILYGSSREEKLFYFDIIKSAYNIRSKLTHGQSINQEVEKILELTNGMDKLLRKIMNNEHEIFLASKKEFDQFFLELVISR